MRCADVKQASDARERVGSFRRSLLQKGGNKMHKNERDVGVTSLWIPRPSSVTRREAETDALRALKRYL